MLTDIFSRRSRSIGLVVVCTFAFVFSAAAQSKFPSPEEVKTYLLDTPRSERYLNVNYYANEVRPPGNYPGPMEGGPPNPKIVEQKLKLNLQNADENISKHSDDASWYETRGEVYYEFYKITVDAKLRADQAEKALADLNRAIALEPARASAYEKRARMLALCDFFVYFDLFMADLRESVRLFKSKRTQNPARAAEYDAGINGATLRITFNYYHRAEILGQDLELLKEAARLNRQYAAYKPWDDFDKAVAYGRESFTEPSQILMPIDFLAKKASVAYLLGENDIALKTIIAEKESLEKACPSGEDGEAGPCKWQYKTFTDEINKNFVRVYVKLKRFGEALPYLDRYLQSPNNTHCVEPFRVRARVYRQLGKPELAEADEQKSVEQFISGGGCYGSKEFWHGLY